MQDLVAKMNPSTSRTRLGTVVTVNGIRKVNVDGNVLTCTWADPMVVDDGDAVTVEFYSAGVGQSRAHVSSRSSPQPRSRTGVVTVSPSGSPTITVTAAGASFRAEQVDGPYNVGEHVHLDWGAGQPRAIGRVATVAPPPPPPVVLAPPPPPPAQAAVGYQTGAAIGSRTFSSVGGWGSWGGDGNKVHQGEYGYGPLSGAWFYGDRFRNLMGRRITKIQFRTGHRLGVGTGGPVTFNFWAHTNPNQPGGDVNRTVGPYPWTAAPNQGATWILLPAAFGNVLANGGGISIYGGDYAAMQGVTGSSPESGALILDWAY